MSGIEIIYSEELHHVAIALDVDDVRAALQVADEEKARDPKLVDAGVLIRIKTPEIFREIMVGLIECATKVWPEIAAEWEALS